jgi:xylitol oxidase
MSGRTTNWAGNIHYAGRPHRPASLDELRHLVAHSDNLRALGSGHSFNHIADSTGDLVSVAGLPPVVEIDTAGASVTVAAGVRYGELAARLQAAGLALHALASLPHITVAGACATGTHGSGDRNGNLATAVSALELVTAGGDLVQLSREADRDEFDGAVVGLGGLGIVTSLTLDAVPTYDVRQYVYDDLPREALDEHWEEIFSSAYSVSLFTDWAGPGFTQMWLKHRVDEPTSWTPRRRWMGARLADGPRHPVPGMPAGNCTEQLGVPGPWHARLPHFRAEFTPSSGEELQSEYAVPRRYAIEALAEIDRIREQIAPLVQICEVRTIAADQLWMSPNHRRDSVAFHFTWVKDTPAVAAVLPAIEERLAPFGARPHWGKLFSTSPHTVRSRYERWPDFVSLLHRYDPRGKFRNEWLDRYLPKRR